MSDSHKPLPNSYMTSDAFLSPTTPPSTAPLWHDFCFAPCQQADGFAHSPRLTHIPYRAAWRRSALSSVCRNTSPKSLTDGG